VLGLRPSGADLLEWFWPEILGSVKGQLGRNFGFWPVFWVPPDDAKWFKNPLISKFDPH